MWQETQALLQHMLVGGDAALFTPAQWATQLPETPVALRFLVQLDAEWHSAAPPDALCVRVRQQVCARIESIPGDGSRQWGHTQRVTGMAVALAAQAGVAPSLAYLAGVCHDVTKLEETETGEPHEVSSARFVGSALRGELPPGDVAAIQAAICKESDDALARLLHDADKLDKIGATGIVRRVSAYTDSLWLASALQRVADDVADFPAMHFATSRILAASKRAFLDWFLPLSRVVPRATPGHVLE